MRIVLDSGGVSALLADRFQLAELQDRGWWPAEVSTAVLAECLTGDHRRDVRANRLLRTCLVRPVTESQGREAARLRTATGRAGKISAVDALVVALASERRESVVLTSDPRDLSALVAHASSGVEIRSV